jgi:hypothetical protein
MSRSYNYQPPPRDPTNFLEESTLANAFTLRNFGFHKHQVFTVLDGSGSTNGGPVKQQLTSGQSGGSFPNYTTYLSYITPPSGNGRASGVNLIQVGDYLAIGLVEDAFIEPATTCFHGYLIKDILDRPNEQSGHFRTEWLFENCITATSPRSPVSGCWGAEAPNLPGSGCTDTRTVIFRPVNTDFFLID